MLNSLPTQILLKSMQPLEPFRGSDDQDVTSWLTDLEELFDAAKQKPEERLTIVPTYLAGDAKQWYRVRGPSDSWPDFKRALVNTFTTSAHQLKTSAQLYNRRQALNESVQAYYYDVMRLCTRLNPEMPSNERLLHLLRGLKPSLAHTIIMLNPSDCSELLEYGKRAEAAAFISQTATSSSLPCETVTAETSAAIRTQNDGRIRSNQSQAASSSHNYTSESNARPYSPRTSDTFHHARPPTRSYTRQQYRPLLDDSFYRGPDGYGRSNPNTRYSHNYTHAPPSLFANQPHYGPGGRQSTVNTNLSCYTCGGHGHRARDCPTPPDHLNF
jgi:hypothetical protein